MHEEEISKEGAATTDGAPIYVPWTNQPLGFQWPMTPQSTRMRTFPAEGKGLKPTCVARSCNARLVRSRWMDTVALVELYL
jgi:hypothetical protein